MPYPISKANNEWKVWFNADPKDFTDDLPFSSYELRNSRSRTDNSRIPPVQYERHKDFSAFYQAAWRVEAGSDLIKTAESTCRCSQGERILPHNAQKQWAHASILLRKISWLEQRLIRLQSSQMQAPWTALVGNTRRWTRYNFRYNLTVIQEKNPHKSL